MSSWDTYQKIISKQNEKRRFETRRKNAASVATYLNPDDFNSSFLTEHITAINGKVDGMESAIKTALSGIADNTVSAIVDSLDSYKRPDISTDKNLTSCSGYIASEISDCDTKINDLQKEINSLQAQYERELAEEEEARRQSEQNSVMR